MSYTSTNQGYYSGGYDGFDDDETSLLPRYLAWAVLVLGFASYLFSFGPLPTGHDASWAVRFAVLAALAAGFGLIPRQSTSHQVVAALAVTGFLDALAVRIGGSGGSGGWALTVIAVLTGLQSVAAIGGLLQAHPADEQDQATAYQAYSEYWAQLQYYGQYAPTAEAPEVVHRAGQGHAGGQASAQAEAPSAARAARPAAAQVAGYEGFVGDADPEHTAFIDRIPAQAPPPPGQAGLPYVGHAQAAAPTQRYGDTSGAAATQASETR